MDFFKRSALFCLGGAAYTVLELLWRGRSHVTMFVLSGGCFLLIGQLGKLEKPLSVPARMLLGSAICTGGELLCGMLFNRSYDIWDYRRLPLNFMGQICAVYSLLWIPVSLAAMELYRLADRVLERKTSD